MKKLMLLLILPALLSLSACTAKNTGDSRVSLRVWVGDNADIPWLERVIGDYHTAFPEKHVSFEIGVQNEGDVAKVILSDVQAAADVFTFADDQLSVLLKAGALMPLSEMAAQLRSDNTPESFDAATGPDGEPYAAPATADNGYFLFYDSRYFSDSDVQSLESMLDKAAEHGKRVAIPLTNGWYLYSFFKGAGLDLHLGEDGLTNICTWNATDTPITGVQVVQSLLAIAAHPGFVSADSDAFVTGIKDGSIIVGVSGTWNASVASQAWGEGYAAAKLPTFRAGGQEVQMASFAGFKLVGVNAYCKDVGEAMDFARFMTAEEAQLLRFEIRRQGPSNLRALGSSAVQAEPAIAAVTAQAPYASVQRVGSKYWDSSAALGKIILDGNPDNTPLQMLLDRCVAGITTPAGQ